MNNADKNQLKDGLFKYLGVFASLIGIILLTIFIASIISDGLKRIDWQFLTNLPSRKSEQAGILTAWTGSLWIFSLTALISIPLGIAAAIYLEEYSKKNRFSRLLEINITNLADNTVNG